MPLTLTKPAWWNTIANYFGFPPLSSTTIDSDTLYAKLYGYVGESISELETSTFLSTQSSVIRESSSSSREKGTNLFSTPDRDDIILGYGAVDYLSAGRGDDILVGGTDGDYFSPGAGIDLVVGSSQINDSKNDTVSYLTATSGIVVRTEENVPTGSGSTEPPPPSTSGTIHTMTYADWQEPGAQYIEGFQTGADGDILDFSQILSTVGYTGTDPVGDGYIRFKDLSNGLKIQFDEDGYGGNSPTEIVRLVGVTSSQFSIADNLAITPPETTEGSGGEEPPPPNSDYDGAYFTLVSDDGQGSYDILYSIENIVGSDFNDSIHGQNNIDNTLFGGLGNDELWGEGGKDILIGGADNDTLHGGADNDVLLSGANNDTAWGDAGSDIFKITREAIFHLGDTITTVKDFATGSSGDKLDLSELLDFAKSFLGHSIANPIGDGFITLTQQDSDLYVKFDLDGASGTDMSAQTVAILENVSNGAFSTSQNLITTGQTILYTSVLGQSNAAGLRVFDGDSESGLTEIRDAILAGTDYDQVYIPPDQEDGNVNMLAVGGSQIDGDHSGPVGKTWWYPDSSQPGEILLRAVDTMAMQIAELRAQGIVKPVIIWGQGEDDASFIGQNTTEAGREAQQQRYIDATNAVFDYIQSRLGDDITFYIMKTSRYNVDAALHAGIAQSTIDAIVDGLVYIREAQDEIAASRDDVKIAVDYIDLPMLAESDPIEDPDWLNDTWHYNGEVREIIGQRIGDFIANDVNDGEGLYTPGSGNTGGSTGGDTGGGEEPPPPPPPPPPPTETDQDLNLSGDTGDNTLVGGSGNDTLKGREGNDTLYGNAGDDTLWGNDGDDQMIGGAGADWMKGGGGADIFVFSAESLGTVDTIADLRTNNGDKIELGDLLSSYSALDDLITDFVRITQNGSDSILAVDTDGTNAGASFVDIAVLTGVTGLNVETLFNDGALYV